jgi:hypothetical protein
MVFTDPPYNVPVDGHVSGLGKVKHREFAMASGEMSKSEFTAFLRAVFERLVAHSADGSIHFVCMDWRHMGEMIAASEGVYPELKNLCVWAKTNAGMGSFYRSQHELIFAFKAGRAAHVNNFGLGEKGRHRSNLWTYAGVNTFRAGRLDDLKAHPTVKPSRMVADAILDCSRRNGIVLDAFTGSGATLVAAEQKGSIGEAIVGVHLMIASSGRLAPYRPLADDHGTDLLVADKVSRGVMHIQVKASYASEAQPPTTTQFDVQTTTVRASAGSYLLAAMIDPGNGALWRAWLIPSTDLRSASKVSAAKLSISPNPSLASRDRYTPWRCRDMGEVVERLLGSD